MTFTSMIELTRLAEKYFDLALPCALEELKKSWRRKVKEAHSDAGGTDALFVELKQAYDNLVAQEGNPLIFSGANGGIEITQEGIPLSQLGLGLGATVNSVDCSRCRHKGYTTKIIEECSTCEGVGSYPPCWSCGGSGKFKQRRAGRIVTCRTCGGSGKRKGHHSPSRNSFYNDLLARLEPQITCHDCHGSGKAKNPQIEHRRCGECHGTGEIRIYNPVIPKGRLSR
jgi:DnaJ-class molecular chaperone